MDPGRTEPGAMAQITGFDWDYIQDIVSVNSNHPSYIVNAPSLLREAPVYSQYLYRPRILIWAPTTQLGLQVKCPFHNTPLSELSPLGSGKRSDQLRKIYHTDGVVHLISAKYQCNGEDDGASGHTIIATDENLLQQVKAKFPVPFQLFHKSGITQDLAQHISHRYVLKLLISL